MTAQRDIALSYINHFFAGDIADLGALLCADLHFIGPLHRFDSAEAYLGAFENDPPKPCSYRLHFQLMDGPDMLTAEGLPCCFREYEVWEDGAWRGVADTIPGRRDRIRGRGCIASCVFET